MIRRFLLTALLLLLVPPALAAPMKPSSAKVVLKTSEGAIIIALDLRRAPVTAGNFLRYVEEKKFDGTSFYRAARVQGDPSRGFIQGGVHRDVRRSLPPIAHEPTSRTGIRHLDGTISMARRAPGTAMGEFFITVGASPSMDANPGGPGDNAGYAAFGRVVSGKAVIRRILAARTWPGGAGAMKGQLIRERVKIIEARRIG